MAEPHVRGRQVLGLEALNVSVEALEARMTRHEQTCTQRWNTAVTLLVVNLLALIGGLGGLLLTGHHGG